MLGLVVAAVVVVVVTYANVSLSTLDIPNPRLNR